MVRITETATKVEIITRRTTRRITTPKCNIVNLQYSNRVDKETVDPYTAQALIYRAEMYILLRYPYLIDVNLKNETLSSLVDENSQFFVIKSSARRTCTNRSSTTCGPAPRAATRLSTPPTT